MKSYLALAAIVLIALGAFLGLKTIGDGGYACGSAFSPDYFQSALTDSAGSGSLGEQGCRDSVSARRPWAFGTIGLGAIALLAALVMPGTWSIEPKRPDEPTEDQL